MSGRNEVVRFVVDAAAAGQRFDATVAGGMGISVAAARRLIDAGGALVDGRAAAKGTTLSLGALVEITAAPDNNSALLPDASMELVILYLDAHLVAIDKPGGVPSHPLRAGERGAAANAIAARFPECAAASLDPREGGLGHRLDTATSGVLIAARSRQAWAALRSALGADDCLKRYLCEVWGTPPVRGDVDAEIGRAGRRGRIVRVGGGGRHPLPAITSWTVLGRTARTALLEARLHAGRAHQVRAHLASAGFPLVGDDRYGASAGPSAAAVAINRPSARSPDASPRLHLHAAAVQLHHPITHAPLLIEAPPPDWARLEAFRPVE